MSDVLEDSSLSVTLGDSPAPTKRSACSLTTESAMMEAGGEASSTASTLGNDVDEGMRAASSESPSLEQDVVDNLREVGATPASREFASGVGTGDTTDNVSVSYSARSCGSIPSWEVKMLCEDGHRACTVGTTLGGRWGIPPRRAQRAVFRNVGHSSLNGRLGTVSQRGAGS